jgi:hypothetical protein
MLGEGLCLVSSNQSKFTMWSCGAQEQQEVLYNTNQVFGRTHHALACAHVVACGVHMSDVGPGQRPASSHVPSRTGNVMPRHASAAKHHAREATRVVAANYGHGSVQAANQELLVVEMLQGLG